MQLWIPLKRLGEPRDRTTGPSYCGTTHLSFFVSFSVGKTHLPCSQYTWRLVGRVVLSYSLIRCFVSCLFPDRVLLLFSKEKHIIM